MDQAGTQVVLPRDELVELQGRDFVDALRRHIRSFWEGKGPVETASYFVRRSHDEIVTRMKAAVFNEMRAAEICAHWVRDVPDVNIRMSLAKQSWQEFRHYKLMCDRLRRLDIDASTCQPTAEQREFFAVADAFFDWLQRVAFEQFAAEGCSTYYQNEELIEVAEEVGDHESAALYRQHIQPDERFHGQIGVRALRDHATTPERRLAVVEAVQRFLDIRSRMYRSNHRTAERSA